MNKADIAAIAKQHRQYQTEAKAKRRHLAQLASRPPSQTMMAMAMTLNEATVMIIRTEAKAVAMEELAAELGIELGTEPATGEPEP